MGRITITISADVAARVQDLQTHIDQTIEAGAIAVARRSLVRADALGIETAIRARIAHDARKMRWLRMQPKYPPGSRNWKRINSILDYEVARRAVEVIVEKKRSED